MYFNRYDIVIAYYLYCAHYHTGMHSPLYERLCHIRTYFNPSTLMSDNPSDTSNNCADIYYNLVNRRFIGNRVG